MSRRSQGLNTLTGKTTCTTRFHCKSSDCVKNMINDIEPLCSGAGHTTSSGTKRKSKDSSASRSHHHPQNKTRWMRRSPFSMSFEYLCLKNNQMFLSHKLRHIYRVFHALASDKGRLFYVWKWKKMDMLEKISGSWV